LKFVHVIENVQGGNPFKNVLKEGNRLCFEFAHHGNPFDDGNHSRRKQFKDGICS
jgi:hypothetical protein